MEGDNSPTRFRSIVIMKKPWTDYWAKKPTKNRVLEAFAHEILLGNIDDYFEIRVEKES